MVGDWALGGSSYAPPSGILGETASGGIKGTKHGDDSGEHEIKSGGSNGLGERIHGGVGVLCLVYM